MESTKNWLNQAIKEGHIDFHAYDKFSNIETIERGALGEVYKAEWADRGIIVMLKSKLVKGGNGKDDTYLLDELKLHKKLDYHPNILQFYGVSQEPSSDRYLFVLDYADEGTLRHYLSKNFKSLSWTDKLNLAKQLVSGTAHLHKEGIIHQDLNPSNILLKDGVIKINGFGLRQLNGMPKQTSDLKGDIAYVEPQCIKNPQYKRNNKSDVYSIGVLLWELSSGKPPFGLNTPLTSSAQIELANKISNGQRERPIKGTPQAYIDIYSHCWDNVPTQRPNILQVLEKLDGITLSEGTREKVLEKSITEKKTKTSNNNGITTRRKSSADRRSVSSISDITSNLSGAISQLHVSKRHSRSKSVTEGLDDISKESKKSDRSTKNISSISIINYNNDNSNSSLKSPKLLNSRRSSFNSPPPSPVSLAHNKKIIANTDNAFFEDLLKFFEEISEISGDTNTMIKSIKEYLHNRMREHKSTFKSLQKHHNDLKYSCLIGFFSENAIGTAQDKQEAFNHYKKSSDSNDSIGQYFLGRCYYWGYGVKQDRKKAFELLEKSSDSGNSRGQWMLGYCYERGYGTTKNLQKAFDQFLASAEAGNTTSQMDLGRCYEDGIGVKKNINKAIECYEKASKGGLTLAQKKLDNLLKQQKQQQRLQNATKKTTDTTIAKPENNINSK